jgi:hypothetical protein
MTRDSLGEDGFRFSRIRSHYRGLRKSIWAPANTASRSLLMRDGIVAATQIPLAGLKPIWDRYKTKVWGSANQYDIQINLRRMEQFVSVGLCCRS